MDVVISVVGAVDVVVAVDDVVAVVFAVVVAVVVAIVVSVTVPVGVADAVVVFEIVVLPVPNLQTTRSAVSEPSLDTQPPSPYNIR